MLLLVSLLLVPFSSLPVQASNAKDPQIVKYPTFTGPTGKFNGTATGDTYCEYTAYASGVQLCTEVGGWYIGDSWAQVSNKSDAIAENGFVSSSSTSQNGFVLLSGNFTVPQGAFVNATSPDTLSLSYVTPANVATNPSMANSLFVIEIGSGASGTSNANVYGIDYVFQTPCCSNSNFSKGTATIFQGVDTTPGEHAVTLHPYQDTVGLGVSQRMAGDFVYPSGPALLLVLLPDQETVSVGDITLNTGSSLPNQSPTTTSVSCSPTQVPRAANVTCTATVSGHSPTGSVLFTQSGTGSLSQLYSCQLSGGTCSIVLVGQTLGSVTITADYQGDNANAASSGSTAIRVVFSKYQSSTDLSCNENSLNVTETTTCTVSVSGPVPDNFTGETVTFSTNSSANPFLVLPSPPGCSLDKTSSCSVVVANGGGSNLFSGQLNLTATYPGDENYTSSFAEVILTANPPNVATQVEPTSFTPDCSPNGNDGAPFGVETINCTVSLNETDSSGYVQLSVCADHPCTSYGAVKTSDAYVAPIICKLQAGSCAFEVTLKAAGVYYLDVAFGGNSKLLYYPVDVILNANPSGTITTNPSTTTSPTTTTAPTTSTGPTSTSTTSSQSTGGGGIPAFPSQLLAATVFTILVAAIYLIVRHRRFFDGSGETSS